MVQFSVVVFASPNPLGEEAQVGLGQCCASHAPSTFYYQEGRKEDQLGLVDIFNGFPVLTPREGLRFKLAG